MNLKAQAAILTDSGVAVEASASEITVRVPEDAAPGLKLVAVLCFVALAMMVLAVVVENVFHVFGIERVLAFIFGLATIPSACLIGGYCFWKYRQATRPTILELDIPGKQIHVHCRKARIRREHADEIVTFEQIRAIRPDDHGVTIAHALGEMHFGVALDEEQSKALARFLVDMTKAGLALKTKRSVAAITQPMHDYPYEQPKKQFIYQQFIICSLVLFFFYASTCEFKPNPNNVVPPKVKPEDAPGFLIMLGVICTLTGGYCFWSYAVQSRKKLHLRLFDDRYEMIDELTGEGDVVPFANITFLYWQIDRHGAVSSFTITHEDGETRLVPGRFSRSLNDLKAVRAFVTVRYERDVEGVAPGEIDQG